MERNQVKFLKTVLKVDKKFHFILKEGAVPKNENTIRLEDIFQVKEGRKVVYDSTWWHVGASEVCVEYVPGDCAVNLVQGIKKNMSAPRHSLWCYNGQAVTREFSAAKYKISLKASDGSVIAEEDFYWTIRNHMIGSRFTAKARRELEKALYRLASDLPQDASVSLRGLVLNAVAVSGI